MHGGWSAGESCEGEFLNTGINLIVSEYTKTSYIQLWIWEVLIINLLFFILMTFYLVIDCIMGFIAMFFDYKESITII